MFNSNLLLPEYFYLFDEIITLKIKIIAFTPVMKFIQTRAKFKALSITSWYKISLMRVVGVLQPLLRVYIYGPREGALSQYHTWLHVHGHVLPWKIHSRSRTFYKARITRVCACISCLKTPEAARDEKRPPGRLSVWPPGPFSAACHAQSGDELSAQWHVK